MDNQDGWKLVYLEKVIIFIGVGCRYDNNIFKSGRVFFFQFYNCIIVGRFFSIILIIRKENDLFYFSIKLQFI